jgi:tetrahydromethanopterin S-methyltransferase subunit F
MNNKLKTQLEYPLKEALLRLSVSPVKADREAISRLERETGKDIQKIIQDLDSIDITLEALEEKSQLSYNKNRLLVWGLSSGSLVGIVALFVLPWEKLVVAIALGFILGISLSFRRS